MSITPLTIYIWQLADDIKSAFFWLTVPGGIVSIVALIIWIMSISSNNPESNGEKEARRFVYKLWHWFLPAFLIGWLISTFTPSSKTVAMMLVIPRLAESKVIQTDLPDLYNTAIEALKTALKPNK